MLIQTQKIKYFKHQWVYSGIGFATERRNKRLELIKQKGFDERISMGAFDCLWEKTTKAYQRVTKGPSAENSEFLDQAIEECRKALIQQIGGHPIMFLSRGKSKRFHLL